MGTKHTPGPWGAYIGEGQPVDRGLVGAAGGIIIADCHSTRGTRYGLGLGEAEANARLVAAAPDLLAACKALDELMERPGDFGDDEIIDLRVRIGDLKALRAAIAKATT